MASRGDLQSPMLLEQASMSFKRGRYKEALVAANHAYDLARQNYLKAGNDASPGEKITVLDVRAMIYFKIHMVYAWRKDCATMIKLDPADARGYLRTGQLFLVKNETLKDALRIYDTGLKKVSSNDPRYKELQRMRNKAKQLLSRFDPVQVLPLEIVTRMFQMLTPQNRVACLRVSRQWKLILSGQSPLWRTMDLSGSKTLSITAINACFRRHGSGLRSAVIANLSQKYSRSKIAEFLSKNQDLKTLVLLVVRGTVAVDFAHNVLETVLKHSSLKSLTCGEDFRISHSEVATVLRNCPRLETAQFYNVQDVNNRQIEWTTPLPCLQALTIFQKIFRYSTLSFEKLNLTGTNSLAVNAPNLKKLRLKNVKQLGDMGEPFVDFEAFPCLQHVELLSCVFVYLPKFPQSLEHLDMHGSSIHTTEPATASTSSAVNRHPLPSLKHISIHSLHGAIDDIMFQKMFLQRVGPSLRHIDVDGTVVSSGWVKNLTCEDVISSLQFVETLSIPLPDLDDHCVDSITENFPNLMKLDLSESKITGVSVKDLVKKCKNLKILILNKCHNIYPDAMKWARSEGVEVQCNFFPPGGSIFGYEERRGVKG